MENANRALIIAGEVLIVMTILSIAVYLYHIFSRQSKTYNDIISENKIEQFNSKFEIYLDKTDITAQNIVTLYNLAKQYGNIEIKVYAHNGILLDCENSEEFLKNNIENLFTENSTVYDENSGKIKKIVFQANT